MARNANRRAQTGPKVTDEVLKRVHEQFPSTAREWDLEMVEVAWDRLSTLLPRKLNRRAAYLAKHGESPPVQ